MCINKAKKEDDKKDSFFITTEEMYRKKYVGIYSFVPKVLIQYVLVLPYYIPVSEEIIVSIIKDEKEFSYVFKEVSTDEKYKYGEVDDEPMESARKYFSKVEMTCALKADIQEDENIDCYFSQLLESLDAFLFAYKTSMKDIDVYNIRIEMLPPIMLCRKIHLKNWQEESHMMILHNTIEYKKELLYKEQLEEVLRYNYVMSDNQNPFLAHIPYVLNSKRFCKGGFYEEAIINIQISIEIFINRLIKELLSYEGKSESYINRLIEDTSLLKLIKTQINIKICNPADIKEQKINVKKWYENAYILRNKVVHAGYEPDFYETEEAIRSSIYLLEHIVKLILQKKHKYAKLSEFFTNREVAR